jgi:hypothetical protein
VVWAKGASGNPGGRPSIRVEGKSLAELARAHTPKALKALVGVLDDDDAPASAKVQAATALLDRAHGKPVQALDIEVRDDASAASLLESARRRAAAMVVN